MTCVCNPSTGITRLTSLASQQGGWLLRWTSGFHMKIHPYVHTYMHTHLVNTHKMETFTFLTKAFPWRNKGRLSSVLEQKTHLVNLTKLAQAIL